MHSATILCRTDATGAPQGENAWLVEIEANAAA